jgi:hypothetical protein
VVNRSPKARFALVSESPPLFNSAKIAGNQLVRVGFANAERARISGGKPETITPQTVASRRRALANARSVKYHGLVLIDEHPMFQMRPNCLCENCLLQVLPFANQIFDCMPVTDPRDVLGDNRTLI